jgi:hypothetical protein
VNKKRILSRRDYISMNTPNETLYKSIEKILTDKGISLDKDIIREIGFTAFDWGYSEGWVDGARNEKRR